MKRVFLLIILSHSSLHAEYRAYQYEIKPLLQQEQRDSYIITSTLNPVHFNIYHGGGSAFNISLIKTWMCHGHTGGFQDFCRSPGNEFLIKKESEKPVTILESDVPLSGN